MFPRDCCYNLTQADNPLERQGEFLSPPPADLALEKEDILIVRADTKIK